MLGKRLGKKLGKKLGQKGGQRYGTKLRKTLGKKLRTKYGGRCGKTYEATEVSKANSVGLRKKPLISRGSLVWGKRARFDKLYRRCSRCTNSRGLAAKLFGGGRNCAFGDLLREGCAARQRNATPRRRLEPRVVRRG